MRKIFIILLITLSLISCAGKILPGKMYSLTNGTEMDFKIQTSYGTGSLSAFNPSTGENFTGQYTGTYQGGGSSHGTIYNANGNRAATVATYSPPTNANARGILKGDKGTIISIYLDIQPGFRPTGHGEGIDNNNVRYQVQF